MDFTVTDELAAGREAATAWMAAHFKDEWAREQRATGSHHIPELHRRLAAEGILAAGWPVEYGGSDVPVAFAQALFGALATRGVLGDAWGSTTMILRTLVQVGTDRQKQTVIPAALRGELLIALGFSEPDSGSDVAAAKTRAVRDGEEWLVTGQKAFTSTVEACTHVFALTRTNPEAAKHRGLTTFLVPTDSPGFEIRPIRTLGGMRTNFTFYSDVRVPDWLRVGDVDRGWDVMRVALVYERAGTGRGTGRPRLSHRVAQWARAQPVDGGTLYDAEPALRERLARIAIDEEVSHLLGMRIQWLHQNGALPGVEGSMAKLFTTEAAQRHYSDLLDLLGPTAALQAGADSAPLAGELEQEFREAVVETIRGGASEILRDIVAERRLGLPRSRPLG